MTAPLRLSPLLPLLLHLLLLVIYPRMSSIRSISSFGKLYKTPVRGSPVSFFFFCRVALYVRIFGCFYSVRELSIPFGVHWMLRLSFGVQLSVIDSHASLSSPLKSSMLPLRSLLFDVLLGFQLVYIFRPDAFSFF